MQLNIKIFSCISLCNLQYNLRNPIPIFYKIYCFIY